MTFCIRRCMIGNHKLFAPKHVQPANVRNIWGWLNSVFNAVDNERVMKGGPDRACAEWLLRCGAKYKWVDSDKWITDYNSLPANSHPKHKIQSVDASESCVNALGFTHFKNCKHIETLKLHKTYYVNDEALEKLRYLKNSLKNLEITSCGDVSPEGLLLLKKLQKLERLYLFDLPLVTDESAMVRKLKEILPNCEIVIPIEVKT